MAERQAQQALQGAQVLQALQIAWVWQLPAGAPLVRRRPEQAVLHLSEAKGFPQGPAMDETRLWGALLLPVLLGLPGI